MKDGRRDRQYRALDLHCGVKILFRAKGASIYDVRSDLGGGGPKKAEGTKSADLRQ